MTIKTTIALEFGNRHHRDEFLRDVRALMLRWGRKAPKLKIRNVVETEAEFGQPEEIDLFWLGVALEGYDPLTPIEAELARLATSITEAANVRAELLLKSRELKAQADAGPALEAQADASDAAREQAELEGASFDPVPATLCERVLHALAAHGPMPAATLAVKVEADAEDVRGELERLHALGDVEPDDGDVWRLVDGE